MRNKTIKIKFIIDNQLVRYIRELSKLPKLDVEEENQLYKEYVNNKQYIKKRLVEGNLRFVIAIALRYTNSKIPFPDLICEGNYGLTIATETFDPTKGVRFITYAYHHIRGKILSSLNNDANLVRIPKNRNLKKHNTKPDSLLDYYSFEKIVDDQFLEFLNPKNIYPITDEISPSNMDKLAIQEFNTDIWNNLSELSKLKVLLESKIDLLPEKEKYVIRAYFEFTDQDNVTLSSLAEELGITKQGVMAIERRALRKLRELLDGIDYLDYVEA